jgi:hypothetical protein
MRRTDEVAGRGSLADERFEVFVLDGHRRRTSRCRRSLQPIDKQKRLPVESFNGLVVV